MLRSLLAVIAGIALLTAVSFAIEAVVTPMELNAPWDRLLMVFYGMVSVAMGGYLAAKLAPRAPMKHAIAMGVLQACLTIVAMFSPEGNRASTAQWIGIAVASLPVAILGGFVFEKTGKKTA